MHAVVNDYDTDTLMAFGDEVVLNTTEFLKNNEMLNHIPVVKGIVGVVKVGIAYRDKRYLSKFFSFLAETSKMSEADKTEYVRKLDRDPKKAFEAGETLLDLIDKVTSREKAIMIGKLVRAYGHEDVIDHNSLMRMCEMVERAYLQDLQGLVSGQGYNEASLESVGIIKPIRHEDIERALQATLERADYMNPTIKDNFTLPPPERPQLIRSGLTGEGATIQRVLRDY